MPHLPRRPAASRTLAAAAALLLAGSLAGCGSGEDPAAGSDTERSASESASPSADATPTPTSSGSPVESAEASPSESPTSRATSSPSSTPPSGGGAPASLTDALLPAAELPGLNDQSPWTEGRTGAVGSDAFGWCARFDALTIGAREGVQRQFRSGEDTAAQQVLDLVDETNAVRAERVLRSWQRGCRGGQAVERRPVQDLATGADAAWWYLSSRARGDGQWESLGVARSGRLVTVLRMQHEGQDHNYLPGEDPLERGLTAAAGRLG